MSGKFWGGGSSEEEESDYSEEEVQTPVRRPGFDELESDAEESEGEQEDRETGEIDLGFSSSSEDEGEREKPKSLKDKRYEEMNKIIDGLSNHLKINDWNAIAADFNNLVAWIKKANNIIKQDGKGLPGPYIGTLIRLEDAVTQSAGKDAKKKMNALNARALNKLKQSLKKHNKTLEKEIEAFLKNPGSFYVPGEEEEPEEQQEDGEDGASKTSAGGNWGDLVSDDEEGDAAADEDEWNVAGAKKRPRKRGAKGPGPATAAATSGAPQPVVWTDELVQKKLNELMKERGRKRTDSKKLVERLKELLSKATTNQRKVEINVMILSCMFEPTSANLTKSMSVQEWKNCIELMRKVLRLLESDKSVKLTETRSRDLAAEETAQEEAGAGDESSQTLVLNNLRAFINQLDAEFSKSLQNLDPHSFEYLERLTNEELLLSIAAEVQKYYETIGDVEQAARTAMKRVEHLYYKNESWQERFEEAYRAKALLKGRAAAAAKAERLAEKEKLLQQQQQQEGGSGAAAVPTTSEEEKKKEEDKEKEETKKAEASPSSAPATTEGEKTAEAIEKEFHLLEVSKHDYTKELEDLCHLIYNHGDQRLKARALLCHVYHHAIHERYHQARDLLLMSHIQDNVQHMDIPTQIFFNRAMVQLGLCAFRAGSIQEAHSCLADICSSSKTREYLAQGISSASRFGQQDAKTAEQEKMEKKRQVPHHQHIPLELLETVHLTAALLLEVPHRAAHPFDVRGPKVISRAFKRLLDIENRQPFRGPPENTRDHCIQAARHLQQGRWQKAEELLLSLPAWKLLIQQGSPSNLPCATQYTDAMEGLKAMLRRKIQEEGLRTYIFTYSRYYDSMSLEELSLLFELPKPAVHSILSKMMINQELHASWDQPSGSLLLHKVEPSRLQYLALQFADKASMFVESNERLMDARTGGYGYSKQEGGKQEGGAAGEHRERGERGERGSGGGGRGGRRQYGNQGGSGGGRGGDGRKDGEGGRRGGGGRNRGGRGGRGKSRGGYNNRGRGGGGDRRG
ncbi:Eukaryotic translation initiation factor 3 subunit C [Balamuthia mandrillaris]